ncbi:hypothetical protein DS901_13045 [Loktanella sp. D2R18]|uniref:hypothetical protein n=1 Tax=Rhodobacterales TaxID=204455 RepID=UPI000DEB9342|nr:MULTISPECIES: hypothetical protein [Rhodobacterales]MDO6591665.1 hypothetical protein [Yoonia sp. 1_MG-2023]RBW42499.1 hypothetical protein DS901_13045 [Loktanella sp. D2R18]
MKVNSKDLITRPTIAAARILTIFGAAIVFGETYGLRLTNIPLIEGELPADGYIVASVTILVFSWVALFVSWRGDCIVYLNWFNSVNVGRGSLLSDYSLKGETPIDGLKRRLQNLTSELSEEVTEFKSADIRDLEIQLDAVAELVSEISPKFERVASWAWMTVYVWYLAVPTLIGLSGVIMLLCPVSSQWVSGILR